jgi:hypothetical protein
MLATVRRVVTAALAAAVVVLGLTTVAHGDTRDTYIKYAKIRNDVYGCVLDRSMHHFGREKRRTCRRLRPLYVLYAFSGESADFHLHCLTSRKCPAPPPSEPSPRAALPGDARVFRP